MWIFLNHEYIAIRDADVGKKNMFGLATLDQGMNGRGQIRKSFPLRIGLDTCDLEQKRAFLDWMDGNQTINVGKNMQNVKNRDK